jgi:hypothetical protein
MIRQVLLVLSLVVSALCVEQVRLRRHRQILQVDAEESLSRAAATEFLANLWETHDEQLPTSRGVNNNRQRQLKGKGGKGKGGSKSKKGKGGSYHSSKSYHHHYPSEDMSMSMPMHHLF